MVKQRATSIQNCPWGTWPGRFIAVAFTLMMVCVLFDRDALKILNVLAWLTMAVAAVTDRYGHRVTRLIPSLATYAFVLASMAAAAWFYGDCAGAVHGFVKYQVGVVWLALVWLVVPLFLYGDIGPGSDPQAVKSITRWMRMVTCTLLLFAWYASISAAAGMFPGESMELIGSEILPYTGVFVILVRCAACPQCGWFQAGARATWLVVTLAVLAMAVLALLPYAVASTAEPLLNAGFFRIDNDAPGTRRLQFIFDHHNRAGYFAALALFISLAGTVGRPVWRVIGIAGAVAAVVALPFTLTRGAMVAAAFGMVLFIFAGMVHNRRMRWSVIAAVAVLIPLGWLTMPDRYNDHIAKIANPASYQETASGSIRARLIMWEKARDMVRKRPVAGFGYGAENFEEAARHDHPEQPDYFKGASHAHNQWLETTAETGIPGLALFLAFTLLRIGGLVVAAWSGLRRRYPLAWLLVLWLSLEITIQFYGMTNYALRRNLGMMTYWSWAVSVVLVFLYVGWRQSARVEPEPDSEA